MPQEVIDMEEKKLKEVEDEINADNEAYEKGESHFREKLTPFADMSKEDFERLKEGLTMDAVKERRTGLVMPPESVRNDPVNQAKVDNAYKRLAEMRTTIPASYSAVDDGKYFIFLHATGYCILKGI